MAVPGAGTFAGAPVARPLRLLEGEEGACVANLATYDRPPGPPGRAARVGWAGGWIGLSSGLQAEPLEPAVALRQLLKPSKCPCR
jgi:hypothetical protein